LKNAEVSGSSTAMPTRTRLPAAWLAGMVKRARNALSSHSNSVGLPAARNGPTGLRASCRIISPPEGEANSIARMPFSNSMESNSAVA
jgi:hypothetical protein